MGSFLIEIDLENLSFISNDIYCFDNGNKIYFFSSGKINKDLIRKCILNERLDEIDIEYDFYTLIEFDKKNRKLTIIQDDFGDLKQVYYVYVDNRLILASKFRTVLKYLNNRQFNDRSLYYFLSCGFIPNEYTLIDRVYKVVPGYINLIEILNKNVKLKKKQYKLMENDEQFKVEKYKELLVDAIYKQIDNNKDYGMTISSGYDSNLLVSLFGNIQKDKVTYYSIGGSRGVDETSIAKKILDEYEFSNIDISYVDENTFSAFPQIVYLYEGLFYERGIFLQFELYKMLINRNINVILGEGADQVLHVYYNFVHDMSDEIKKEGYSLYKCCPGEMLLYLVLKKSSLLLSNTSNKLIYPYLSKEFVSYVNKIRNDNGFDKKVHKEIVIDSVSEKISTYLEKIGGATDQIALFKNDDEFLKWKNIVLNSKFSLIECERNTTELSLDMDYVLKIIYLMLFEKIFILSDEFILDEDLITKFNIYDFFD